MQGEEEGGVSSEVGVSQEEQEEFVGEGLGLSDDESDDEEDEPSDFLVAVFDRQSKVKGRWKINLKSGIFHMAGRDHLFTKALMHVTFK